MPFQPSIASRGRSLKRPFGVFERLIVPNDPLAKFSVDLLLDFTRPELSPILLGPCRPAGGYESCGVVFQDAYDPDYQALLAAIVKGKAELDASPRYGTPGFKPNPQYLREMKRATASCPPRSTPPGMRSTFSRSTRPIGGRLAEGREGMRAGGGEREKVTGGKT